MPTYRCASALAGTWVFASAVFAAAASRPAGERIVVPLEGASAFKEARDHPNLTLVRGQLVSCTSQPAAEVRKYPALKSGKALYGQADFARPRWDRPGAVVCPFVLDETKGTGKGYDRLFLDLDQDGDLTNDKPIGVMRHPPDWQRYQSPDLVQVMFDNISVTFDLGPGIGTRPFTLMPCLNLWKDSEPGLCFIATEVRRGEMTIGGERIQILLSQPFFVSGRYDGPGTQMNLLPEGKRDMMSGWWGRDQLRAKILFGDQLYEFSTTPLGDRFTAQPYRGEFGLLRMGAGGRKVDKATMRGSLDSESASVAVGQVGDDGWPEETAETRIPVGDYTANMLHCRLGRLSIETSMNYHSDGAPRERKREVVHGVHIRKDKPFVLDFSSRPEVMFACPGRDRVLHPGEEINIQAVLIDPGLDIMIRGLSDITRKQKKTIAGTSDTYEQDLSLDPIVVVTDGSGKRVAEGTMPFG